jgi:hypothetical protein
MTSSTSVTECSRLGGDVLTVIGSDFGAAGASVFVGSDKCINVRHDLNAPHGRLTCELPAGNRLDRPLVLFQRNGELSQTEASVSFTQCPKGQHEDDLNCVPCEFGKYVATTGSLECVEVSFYSLLIESEFIHLCGGMSLNPINSVPLGDT